MKLLSHKFLFNLRHYKTEVLKILVQTKNNIFKDILNPHYWKLLDESYEREYYDELKKIRVPVTFIWGIYDSVFNVKNYKVFKKYLKRSELVKVNGGHDWPIYEPELIEGYLSRDVS
jgi:pimeloyl-ACP methyl ester carboxylesterase